MVTISSIYITYIEKEGPYIKLWGQTDRSLPIAIEKALQQMTPQFEQGMYLPGFENFQVGLLCCAKFRDGSYYRARITNISYLRQRMVEVLFIDYGNRDVVSCESIRTIANLSASLISIPAQARDFILANVSLKGWDVKSDIEMISNELRYLEFQMVHILEVGPYVLISLYANTRDVTLNLLSQNLVLSVPLQMQQMTLQSLTESNSPSLPINIPQQVVSMSPVQPKNTMIPQPGLAAMSPPTILNYKAMPLDYECEHKVYISYVSDGPCLFSVQLKKMEEPLKRLMIELNSIDLQPLEEFPLPGTVCLAQSTEDGYICRAVITSMVDGKYKVFYVDFGNTELLSFDKLFQIPFKYVIPKVMATRFALSGVEQSTVSIEMKCSFKEFVNNKLLTMKVIPSATRSAVPHCDLRDENNIRALDVIKQQALQSYPNPIPPSRGFNQEIKVSFVYSCNRFYVQLKSKEPELSKLMDDLQNACISIPALNPSKAKEGIPCYAFFAVDGLWYRAQIISINSQGYKVRYVDYGNEEIVMIDCLKEPSSEQILALRPQAIECCLNGYQNMEADEQRDSLLEELILEQEFTMKVVEIQGNKALIDLFDSAHYNVASLLLDKIATATSQVSPLLIQDNHRIEHRKRSSPEVNYQRDREKKSWDMNDRNQDDKSQNWRQNKFTRNTDQWEKSNSFEKGGGFQKSMSRNSSDNQDSSHTGDGFSRNEDQRNKTNSFEKREYSQRKYFRNNEQQDDSDTHFNRKDSFQKSNRNYEDRDNAKSFEKRDSYQNRNNRNDYQKDKPYFEKRNRNENFQNERRNDDFQPRKFNKGFGDQESADGSKSWKNEYKKDGSEKSWSDSSEKNYKGAQKHFDKPYKSRKEFKSPPVTTDGESWKNISATLNLALDSDKFKNVDNVGCTETVEICWFYNPTNFYCQLNKYKDSFKKMMEEIQQSYKNRNKVKATVGAPVIASFPDDGVLYRAEVLSVNLNKFNVRYVDYGNKATVDFVYGIETKYMDLPAQAINCALQGIAPSSDNWPGPENFEKYFAKDMFLCSFISEKDGRFYVDLSFEDISVAALLLEEHLAVSLQSNIDLDISLLVGQQIVIVLKNVASLSDVTIQLEPEITVSAKLHNLEMATETFEDVLSQWVGHLLIVYVDNIIEDRLEVTFYDLTGQKLEIVTPDEGAFETVDTLCAFPIYTKTLQGWVSHATSNILYIQPSRFTDKVSQLLESLYEYYESILLEEPLKPEVGFVYAVHSTDTNWYRGRVTEIVEDNVNVMYVDYGNSEIVPIIELRELIPQFFQPHMLAVEVLFTDGCEALVEQDVTVSLSYGENGWDGTIISPTSSAVIEASEQAQSDLLTSNKIAENTNENQHDEQHDEVPQAEILTNEPQIGVNVVLSHVDTPGEFYLQLFDALETIDTLQQRLQEEISTLPDLESPTAGVLCAAPYSVNQEWYRAQVLDADDDITTVRFVDFGNTDVISNASTSIKTLPPDLLSMEQHARLCSLYAKPVGSEWSGEAFNKFEEYASVESLCAEILHQDEKVTYVELYCNGNSLTQMLKNEGLAGDLELQTETKSTGFISHLNSPSEFWIQLENSVPDLECVAEQLSTADTYPALEDLTPGSLCAAIFSGDDSWYRARILSNTVAGLEVIFIDYGNSCSCSSLRELPEDLIMLPALAHKCSLQKPPGILQWSSDSTIKFREISADGATVFNVNILTAGETSIVQLTINDTDISNQLLPETKDCAISQFDSIDSFWVQMSEDTEKLELMAEEMTQAEAWPQVTEVEENDLVAASYEDDGLWYRARILKKVDEGYKILFVDYGNTTVSNDIRQLPDSCMKEAPMAFNYKLDILPRTKWAPDAEEKFAVLSNDGSTIFQMESVNDNIVRLYLNGNDIRATIGTVKHTPVVSSQNSPKKSCDIPSDITENVDDLILVPSSEKEECEIETYELPNTTEKSQDKIDNMEEHNYIETCDKVTDLGTCDETRMEVVDEKLEEETFVPSIGQNKESESFKTIQHDIKSEMSQTNEETITSDTSKVIQQKDDLQSSISKQNLDVEDNRESIHIDEITNGDEIIKDGMNNEVDIHQNFADKQKFEIEENSNLNTEQTVEEAGETVGNNRPVETVAVGKIEENSELKVNETIELHVESIETVEQITKSEALADIVENETAVEEKQSVEKLDDELKPIKTVEQYSDILPSKVTNDKILCVEKESVVEAQSDELIETLDQHSDNALLEETDQCKLIERKDLEDLKTLEKQSERELIVEETNLWDVLETNISKEEERMNIVAVSEIIEKQSLSYEKIGLNGSEIQPTAELETPPKIEQNKSQHDAADIVEKLPNVSDKQDIEDEKENKNDEIKNHSSEKDKSESTN